MISIINISQQQKDGIRLQPIIDELPDGYALFREREREHFFLGKEARPSLDNYY